MKKRTIIVILGLWIALLPFLGLPGSWKKFILIVSGLAIAGVAGIRRKKFVQASGSSMPNQSFGQSTN